jgi:hypothetical protein
MKIVEDYAKMLNFTDLHCALSTFFPTEMDTVIQTQAYGPLLPSSAPIRNYLLTHVMTEEQNVAFYMSELHLIGM